MLTNEHVLPTVKVGLLHRLVSYSAVKYSESFAPITLEVAPFEKENSRQDIPAKSPYNSTYKIIVLFYIIFL